MSLDRDERMDPQILIRPIDGASPHLDAVKALWRANASILGFMPNGGFADHAARRWIIVALDSEQRCVGYLLYRIARNRATIVHLCVDSAWRRCHVGRELVEYLCQQTRHLSGISLKCRRDYEANRFWPALGFVATGDRPGRGKDNGILTTWWLDHGHPTLFSWAATQTTQRAAQVVLDANVFIDLYQSDGCSNEESEALLADWLTDTIELCLTDEILNEINRNPDDEDRHRLREFAHTFAILPHSAGIYNKSVEMLRPLFPERMTDSDWSDLRQVSKAIASGSQFFITRDDDLLDLSDQIYEMFGLSVVRPVDMIVQLDELRREVDYQPARLAGTLLEISLLQNSQIDAITTSFQSADQGETKAAFQRRVRNFLAQPDRYACQAVIGTGDVPLALIVSDRLRHGVLEIPMLRVARNSLAGTLASHLTLRCVLQAVSEQRPILRVSDRFLPATAIAAVQNNAFSSSAGNWVKLSLAVAAPATHLSSLLGDMATEDELSCSEVCRQFASILTNPSTTNDADLASSLEHALWPAKITDACLPNFIIPIRPSWARELFDEGLANQTLYGARPELALNREAVYYRSRHASGGLRAPARILWYVSNRGGCAGAGCLRACSQLDEVIVGKPKGLFRRFRRLGVYEWHNIVKTSRNNFDEDIMALRFSNTELLTHPIGWADLKSTMQQFEVRSQLQSPCKVSPELFAQLYTQGTRVK
jgi:predicted nucleic acid-binding protein/GNAT superfamily N-acetyltransferase